MTKDVSLVLAACLQELHLPAVKETVHEAVAHGKASAETWSYPGLYLRELMEGECQQRRQHRIELLLLRESKLLPLEKSWSTLDLKRLPPKVVQQLQAAGERGLCRSRHENVLAFGSTGFGEDARLGGGGAQELVRAGRRVLFTTCSLLVQELLVAGRDLTLKGLLKRLVCGGRWIVVLDDLGYVQQSREEMEVLFTLLAGGYERGSVLLVTSNLPFFSKWEQSLQGPG